MFTVTITKTTIEERPAGKDWEVVRADKTAEYGYTPEIMKKREVELKVYEQTVDKLDIKTVIAAVNRLLAANIDVEDHTAWYCPEPGCKFCVTDKGILLINAHDDRYKGLCPACKKGKISDFEMR